VLILNGISDGTIAQLEARGRTSGKYKFTNKASSTITPSGGSANTEESNEVSTVIQPPTFPAPTKTVSDSNENNVTGNTLSNANEGFSYRVSQALPAGLYPGFHLTSFSFEDTIDQDLSFNQSDVKIFRGASDVTSLFTIAFTGQKITATAKAATLTGTDFYSADAGTTYTLTIPVKIDQSKTADELRAHGHYNGTENQLTFTNKGSSHIEDKTTEKTKDTSTVTTKVGVPDLSIVKEADRYEYQVGEDITYTVTVKHTDASTADATNVRITDVIPSGLQFKPETAAASGISSANTTLEATSGGIRLDTDVLKQNETATIIHRNVPSFNSGQTIKCKRICSDSTVSGGLSIHWDCQRKI
jgi:fimbrial isopeptide formation D2 family protein/uncharacterized repeat protein (TIGR01451 family)